MIPMAILRIAWVFFIELPWEAATPIVDKAVIKLNEIYNGKKN